MLQGLLGAVLALAVLVATHGVVAPSLAPLVNLTLGLPAIAFLPPLSLAVLLLAGTVLGGLGGWLARAGREA
jgi:cell division protein FtsX